MMRVARRQSGPFREQLFYHIDEIDEICSDALKDSGCLPDQPEAIDVERFVEKHFQCDIGYEDLPNGVLGVTAFDTAGRVVSVRVASNLEDGSKVGERRVRATWAHEGGHGLLHARLFIEVPGENALFNDIQENVANRRFLCRDSDIKPVGTRYDGRWWEWQANRAIGGLLLPRVLVRQMIDHVLIQSLVTGNATLPAAARAEAEQIVAEKFNVNPIVARIRLAEMFPDKNGAQMEF